jgi:hypothetical protein
MGNVISFFIGIFCGMVIIAVLNACSDESKITDAYMEGYLAGQEELLKEGQCNGRCKVDKDHN